MPADMESRALLLAVPELAAEHGGEAGGAAEGRRDRSPRTTGAWKVAALPLVAGVLALVAVSSQSTRGRSSEKLREAAIVQESEDYTENATDVETTKKTTVKTTTEAAADDATDGAENASGADAPADGEADDGCKEVWTGPCEDDKDCCEGTTCDTSNPSWAQCAPAQEETEEPENQTEEPEETEDTEVTESTNESTPETEEPEEPSCMEEWQGECKKDKDCCENLFCDTDADWPMCSPIKCVQNGKNCARSKCCSEPGMQCYKKNDHWSACNATCTAEYLWVKGSWVETNETQWDCKEVGERSPGGADASGEDSGSGDATTTAAPVPATTAKDSVMEDNVAEEMEDNVADNVTEKMEDSVADTVEE